MGNESSRSKPEESGSNERGLPLWSRVTSGSGNSSLKNLSYKNRKEQAHVVLTYLRDYSDNVPVQIQDLGGDCVVLLEIMVKV